MEVQLLVTGCVACGASLFVLVPGPSSTVLRGRRGGLNTSVPRALERLGGTAPVRALRGWAPWQQVAEELARRLFPTGEVLSQGAACAALLVAWTGFALLLWLLSASPLGLVVGVIVAPLATGARAASIARSRDAALMGEMPAVLRSLSTALGAGSTLSQAIEYVATHERGVIAREFERAALGLRCGGTVREALEGIERRLDVPGIELMTCALLISQRTGSPLRSLFSRSAELVEEQVALRALLSTKTAQVRLSVRIVCLMPVAMVVLLSLISPEFRSGVTSATGIACVSVAAALDLVAILIVRRLMRGVLG